MSNSENKEVFINFCESSSLAYGYTTLLERFATKYDIEEAAAINAIIELNSNGDTLHFMHSYGSAIAEVFQAQAEYTGFDNAITHIVKILKNKEVEVSEADVMNVLFGENYTDINQQIAGVLFVELQNELKVQLNHWTTDNHDGLCSKRIAYKEYVALLSGRRPIVYSGDMQKEDHLSIGTVRAITKLADGVGIENFMNIFNNSPKIEDDANKAKPISVISITDNAHPINIEKHYLDKSEVLVMNRFVEQSFYDVVVPLMKQTHENGLVGAYEVMDKAMNTEIPLNMIGGAYWKNEIRVSNEFWANTALIFSSLLIAELRAKHQ